MVPFSEEARIQSPLVTRPLENATMAVAMIGSNGVAWLQVLGTKEISNVSFVLWWMRV